MTWIVSGTLLSIILSFRWAYLRSRSFKVTTSRKVQTENFWFGCRDTCFWVSFSSRTQRMTIEHFLNGRNRINFENRENAGNRMKQRKKWPFWDLQQTKLGFFQDIYMTFCTHIHLTGFIHIDSFFLIKKPLFLKIPRFVDYFSKFPKFIKFW